MDVTSANRFHIGEITMSALLRVPLIILLGASIGQLALYELLMFAVVQFHHANISVSARWDRVLRWFIVTPYLHKVHHSRWQPETDSNYSSFLSIWDRLFSHQTAFFNRTREIPIPDLTEIFQNGRLPSCKPPCALMTISIGMPRPGQRVKG